MRCVLPVLPPSHLQLRAPHLHSRPHPHMDWDPDSCLHGTPIHALTDPDPCTPLPSLARTHPTTRPQWYPSCLALACAHHAQTAAQLAHIQLFHHFHRGPHT